MTDEEIAAFRENIREALASPSRMTVFPPLPRRVRLRLRFHRRVDDVAYWLVCHGHCTAARRLWQACGMW